MKRLELHLLNVFTGDEAFGNPTGVILLREGLEEPVRQALATRLGYPDTAFVRRGGCDEPALVQAHSPAGPLSLCVQALLATDAVLREGSPGGGPISLRIGDRGLETRREGEMTWLTYPAGGVGVSEDVPGLESLLGELPGEARPCRRVDAGRVRLVQEVPEESLLELLEPSPNQVAGFCDAHSLDGVVLFTRMPDADAGLRVRVFTTSLEGGEDAATGGAALALAAYLEATGTPVNQRWTIDQGQGAPRRRGRILFERGSDDSFRIGGRVEAVAVGEVPLP